MKPFNLERAQAGDPVEYMPFMGDNYVPCRFIGMTTDGAVVMEREIKHRDRPTQYKIFRRGVSAFRMAPKEVVKWGTKNLNYSHRYNGPLYDTEAEATVACCCEQAVCRVTWQE